MAKKFFLTFIFVLFILGITNVQAITSNSTIIADTENLDKLIINKSTGEYLKSVKYKRPNVVIFEKGDNQNTTDVIKVGRSYEDEKVMRIIKNGYNLDNIRPLNIEEQDDLYIATKIAIDCAGKENLVSSVNDFYEIGNNLSDELKLRASNIIKTADKLLKIGNEGTEKYTKSIEVKKIGDFEKDKLKDGYYSQTFEITGNGVNVKSGNIADSSISGVSYYLSDLIGNNITGVSDGVNKFKIMVEDSDHEKTFIIIVNLFVNYDTDRLYKASGGEGEYIVYGTTNITEHKPLKFTNKLSSLAVNLVDKETGQKILGGKVEINGEQYLLDKENKILLNEIGVSNINLKVISVPDDYVLEEKEYTAYVKFKENHVEDIEIMHKKGNLVVNTNLAGSIYELYTMDNKLVDKYITDEKGNIDIKVNTGTYLLKQTAVKGGYKLAKNSEFKIEHEKITQLKIINERKEVEENGEETGKNENDKKPNGIFSENNNNETSQDSDNNNEKGSEEKQQENENKNESINEEKGRTVLPRTGNDYFIIKLILCNFIFLIIFNFIYFYITNKNSKSSKSRLQMYSLHI